MKELFKKYCLVTTALTSLSVNAITFKSQVLQDNTAPNYLKFTNPNNSLSNSFEKVVADFNGDGRDDILSLGGVSLVGDGVGSIPLPPSLVLTAPTMSMMLSNENEKELQFRDLGFNYSSPNSVIVDIDKDGDIDIIMQNCKVALNDGEANFTLTEFDDSCNIPKQFYAVDIDADSDIDIITHDNIYLNDGSLNFSKIASAINVAADAFSVADINKDDKIDILVLINNKLESWINDGAGEFALQNSTDIPENVFLIHPMPINTDDSQDIMLAFNGEVNDYLKLMTNDGSGNFVSNDFELALVAEIQSDEFKIGKFYNKDADNNGSDDLWVAAIYRDNDSCSSYNQNLLFLYKKQDDAWQQNALLHSEGLIKNNLSQNRVTVDSLPTILDLNGDNLPEVVLAGYQGQTWINKTWVNFDNVNYFRLSDASLMQYTQSLDTADYDGNGHTDIFAAVKYSGFCGNHYESYDYPENFYTAYRTAHSILWLSDGAGQFESFLSPVGGGNGFLRRYEYTVFADLEDNDEQNLIVTIPATGNYPRISRYINPRLVYPRASFDLPAVTLNAKVAKLDTRKNERQIVMVADTEEAPIIVAALGEGGIVEIARLDFGARNGEFKLADVDSDGFIDIVASTRADNDSIKIWYNDGLLNFTLASLPSQGVKDSVVMDIDNDGSLDIMAANSTHDIWINQGQRNFVKLDYDDSFWYEILSPGETLNKIPDYLRVVDWNQDSKPDLLVSISNTSSVYINQSTPDKVSFYKIFVGSNRHLRGREKVADFNNDSRMDYLEIYNKAIVIHQQTDEEVTTGLYYDPTYDGHGFSIDEIGRDNLYYSVFYTYDDAGKPEWFSALGRHLGSPKRYRLVQANNSRKIKYSYNYLTQSAQISDATEQEGRITFQNSNVNNPKALSRVLFNIYASSSAKGWSIEEIIPLSQRPENDLSGHWWAGENDSGWGITLNFKEVNGVQTVVATLYFYDEAGQPVWVIGTQEGFELNQDITINMEKVNGYGRLQNSVELTRLPAGTITINLNQASQNINEAGRLSMDIHYPDDSQNNNWAREAIPFGLLSKPRVQ